MPPHFHFKPIEGVRSNLVYDGDTLSLRAVMMVYDSLTIFFWVRRRGGTCPMSNFVLKHDISEALLLQQQ